MSDGGGRGLDAEMSDLKERVDEICLKTSREQEQATPVLHSIHVLSKRL